MQVSSKQGNQPDKTCESYLYCERFLLSLLLVTNQDGGSALKVVSRVESVIGRDQLPATTQ